VVAESEPEQVFVDADGVVHEGIAAMVAAAEGQRDVGARASDEASPAVGEDHPPLVAHPPAAAREATAAARPRSREVAESGDEVPVTLGDRKWRVRGLSKNTRLEAMKVDVLVARDDGGFHVDALELVGYLAATSRKLEQPLAVVIQSSSAAGKSSLMDAVLNLMPEEERTQYSCA